MINTVYFDSGYDTAIVYGLYQWDRDVTLEIKGVEINGDVWVQFSMDETGGMAVPVYTKVENGVISAEIPGFVFEKETTKNYLAYAFVYETNIDYGKTIKTIKLNIKSRPKPDDYVYTEPEKKRYELLEERIKEIEENGVSGGNIVVDSELSLESENPVQNKVVAEELGRLSEEIVDEIESRKNAIKELSEQKANVIVDSANGNNIVITDSANEKPRGMKLFGKSEQNATGGNQLLVYPYVESTGTKNNVKYTDNGDGSITIKGTATSDAYYGMYRNIDGERLFLKAGVYTLSCDEVHPSWYISINMTNAASVPVANLKINNSQPTTTFTVNEDVYIYSFIIVKAGYSVDATVKPMLNTGTIALPFEPYTGGIPSLNPDNPQEITSVGDDGSVDVGVYGNNLVDYSDMPPRNWEGKQGNDYSYNNGVLSSWSDANSFIHGFPLINLKKDENYTVSFECVDGIGKQVNVGVEGYSPDGGTTNLNNNRAIVYKKITLESYNKVTLEIPKYMTMGYFGFNVHAVDGVVPTVKIKNFQVEQGLVATPYKPNTKQSLTISTPNGLPGIKVTDSALANYTDENGKMWCCDEIDLERGKYIKRIKKDVVLASELQEYNSTDNYIRFITNQFDDCTEIQENALCSHFLNKGYTSNSFIVDKGDKRTSFMLDKTVFPTASEAKAFFENNQVMFIGTLIDQIETDLTVEQYETLTMNYPSTTLLSDAHLQVDYVADTKGYIDKKFAELATALVAVGGV